MPVRSGRHHAAVITLIIGAAAVLTACGSGSAAGDAADATRAPGSSASAAQATALPLEVSTAAASVLRDAGAFVLDVREPDEFAAGHIPEATNIPLGQLAARSGELPKAGTILVVCRTGHRSAQGRDLLLGAGFTAVTSMAGGMTDWVAAGYPTTPPG